MNHPRPGCSMLLARTPVLAWAADTGRISPRQVNGGAIAIGHPLGASGVRIMTTLINAWEQCGKRYGLQTMCEGGGMANATIIERLGYAAAQTVLHVSASRTLVRRVEDQPCFACLRELLSTHERR